ncbi:endonuclease domain-containing protein [Maricaulaceae bacterium MS644]
MTEPEALLWSRLRFLNREGVRIRRQAPMGPYIVDFVCHSAKLVIELDGGGHGEPEQAAHDRRRDAWLAGRGYEVVRIWNNSLYGEHDGVMGHLIDTLRERHRASGRAGS